MQLNIKILECTSIPTKSFLNSYCDYFMTFEVSGVSSVQNTKVINDSVDPIFNSQFSFILNDVNSSVLRCTLKTPTFSGAKPISFIEIPLNEFEEYENFEKSFEMRQADDPNAFGGNMHVILQIAPAGTPAFFDRSHPSMTGICGNRTHMNDPFMMNFRSAPGPMMERNHCSLVDQRQYRSMYCKQNSMFPNNNINQVGYGMFGMRNGYPQMNNRFVQPPQFPQQIPPRNMYFGNTPC